MPGSALGDTNNTHEAIVWPRPALCHLSAPRSVRETRIIVAGSAQPARRELRFALEREGYRVSEARTADQMLEDAYSGRHHLIILVSGYGCVQPDELCRWIRLKSDIGIIVLAGADAKRGSVDTLNAGAACHLPSTLALPELLARVRALLRRTTRLTARARLALENEK